MKLIFLDEENLSAISGGKVCSIFDIGCTGGEAIAWLVRQGRNSHPTPPTCSYPSSWNPAPAIRCY